MSQQYEDIIQTLKYLDAPSTMYQIVAVMATKSPSLAKKELIESVKDAFEAGAVHGYLKNKHMYYYAKSDSEEQLSVDGANRKRKLRQDARSDLSMDDLDLEGEISLKDGIGPSQGSCSYDSSADENDSSQEYEEKWAGLEDQVKRAFEYFNRNRKTKEGTEKKQSKDVPSKSKKSKQELNAASSGSQSDRDLDFDDSDEMISSRRSRRSSKRRRSRSRSRKRGSSRRRGSRSRSRGRSRSRKRSRRRGSSRRSKRRRR